MITIKKEILEKIIVHLKGEFPNEGCGILAGKDCAEVIYPMKNLDKRPDSFFMESAEQLKVMKDIRDRNLEMLAIYHSHPETPARPSLRDVEFAFYPEVAYIIVSLKDKNSPDPRSFRIVNGDVEEEEIKII